MQILRDVSLKPYNSFGIDVKAKFFTELHSDDEIAGFFSALTQGQQPVFLLGGGSNVLFTRDFEGTVAAVRNRGIQVLMEDADHVWLRVAAGESWDHVVDYTVEKGWGGIENLSLIPGTAGAAPVQNIGAYGVELKDVVYSVEAADINQRNFRSFRPGDCDFGYRSSLFKKEGKGRLVITHICLKLDKRPVLRLDYGNIRQELEQAGIKDPSLSEVRKIIIKIRRDKLPDPALTGSAGSFFMNPVVTANEYSRLIREFPGMPSFPEGGNEPGYKLPGAWLIGQCGWKGRRVGDAGVWDKQPLVLVNYGNASGTEILELAEMITVSVKERFGIELKKEVVVL